MPPKIRDILDLLKRDGWIEASVRGLHHRFKHSTNPAGVTVLGSRAMISHRARSTASSSKPDSRGDAMRDAIVIEKAESNHSAYVPDPPGCITTGATIAEIEQGIREATELHLAGMREDGQSVP